MKILANPKYDSFLMVLIVFICRLVYWCLKLAELDRSTDTSDPGHFGPKTVRHYVFSTEMSYFFLPVCRSVFGTLRHQCRTVLTFYERAEVSNGHFGTGTEVSRTDRWRVLVPVSLHHLTSHLHHLSRYSDSVSRHIVYNMK